MDNCVQVPARAGIREDDGGQGGTIDGAETVQNCGVGTSSGKNYLSRDGIRVDN